ncbi:membrane protein [methanotrophic bacterial endosymbiont of Bathymodiolus sp.]|nr:membrane protein [methanotrophic bacterial endosymbiont of Bathymodiolus sp.]
MAVSSAKVVGTTSSLRLSYFVLMVDLYSQYLALTLTATSYLCVLGQKNTHVFSLFIILVAWLTSVKAVSYD